ncbi:MAG: hypothetical protein WBA68_04515 [Alteraurantiacibacter sp.]
MPKPDIEAVQQLQEQVYALQQVLLSTVLAMDALDATVVDDALVIAAGQADSALATGRPIAAMRIGALIEDINQCRTTSH